MATQDLDLLKRKKEKDMLKPGEWKERNSFQILKDRINFTALPSQEDSHYLLLKMLMVDLRETLLELF